MKLFSKTRLVLSVVGLGSLLAAGTASADYRVAAFGYSSEYDAILSKDVDTAMSIFSNRSLGRLDFVESNNLCVTQILAKEFGAAVASCDAALRKVGSDKSVGIVKQRSAMASIHSNLAVAKALSGDIEGASAELEKALSLNSRDANAVANYSELQASRPASELAQRV